MNFDKERNITLLLMFCTCIGAMVFFALARLLGFTNFVVERVEISLPIFAEIAILYTYHATETVITAKILTSKTCKWCIVAGVTYTSILYLLYLTPLAQFAFIYDLMYMVAMPIVLQRTNYSRIKTGLSTITYVTLISFYTVMMQFGRYGVNGKTEIEYAILSTIDYKFFLVSILLIKEYVMDFPHCLLFWGKFSDKVTKGALKVMSHFSQSAREELEDMENEA